MNSVLDRTPACPNVDVRLLNPGLNPAAMSHGLPPTGINQAAAPVPTSQQQLMGGNPGNLSMMHPSFLENPTFFLAQQAAFVNNSLNTSGSKQPVVGDTEAQSSAQCSPVARLAPGRSPPLAPGKSPISSPGPLSLPSPASQSTPSQVTPPRSRRSSVGSHSNTVSPCVTPHSNMKSPPGVGSESPCSANNESSSSTATAPSGGSSFSQSPGSSSCAQSPSSGQRIPGRQNASPISLRGSQPHAHLFDMANKLISESDLPMQKLPKSPKGARLKGGTGAGGGERLKGGAGQAKNKLNNQNQMNLSFSNALEFQQLLSSKYGTGNFPASNLLTAAAKAQGNNCSNPLTQALTQLQQGLTTHCSRGQKGRGKKGANAAAAAAVDSSQDLSAGAPGGKKDDFHAGSFLVNESGQLEGGSDALVAALLGNNPSLATNCSQAQLLLQQLSNLNGQNNDSDGVVRMDPEQLAASQVAMLNMLMSGGSGSVGNQGNSGCSGKDGAQSTSAHNAIITGLDVAHNAIISAFNASNAAAAGDSVQKAPARGKRRRSAPQGDPSLFNSSVSPAKYARPRSAPGGGANVMLSPQFFPDTTTNFVANSTSSSSSSELKSPSQAVTMVTSASSKSPVLTPSQFEGMPPLSAAPSVTTVTSSIPHVISTACVAAQQPTTVTSAVTIPQQQQQQQQQQVMTQQDQLMSQLQLQLNMFNPQQQHQLNTAHLTGAQLLELQQQLINQQQQLFQQGQNELLQSEDLQQQQQQQMGLLQQAMNPMFLQQQLAQYQQQAGGLGVDIIAQLQLSQMAMGGQLPEQTLAQIVQQQASTVQQQAVADKDIQQQQETQAQAGNGEHSTSVDEQPDSMEVAEQQRDNSDETKPAETMTTQSPEKAVDTCESSTPVDCSTTAAPVKASTPSRSRQGEYNRHLNLAARTGKGSFILKQKRRRFHWV